MQAQDVHLEDIISLKIVMIGEDIPKKRVSSIGVWGAISKTSPSKRSMHNQERSSNMKTQGPSSYLKWNAQGKGMILIGFLFYRSHGVCWETGL